MATDVNGNIYLGGLFLGDTITFEGTLIFNANIGASALPGTSLRKDNAFLAKYDSSGKLIWAMNPAHARNYEIKSITTEASGNVYVTGSFGDSSIKFGSITLRGGRSQKMFIVKYGPTGNVIWAKSAFAGNDEGLIPAFGTIIDKSSNLYTVGYYFGDTAVFGSLKLLNSYSSSPQSDMFIVKYDSSGNALWA